MTIPASLRKDIIPVLAAVFITGYLFYIDEGYYDFRWMKDPGSWFAFLIYSGTLLGAQYVISEIVFKRMMGVKKTLLTLIIGIPLGIVFIAGIFWLLAYSVRLFV